jgi:hypothetical protein
MDHTLTIEVPDALAEAWRKLPPAHRSSLVDYAGYLASQVEEQRLDDEDDAAWEQRVADPVKAARFLEWGQQALAGPGDAPLDLKQL